MLFSPRHRPGWPVRVRDALWPRRGFVRAARYIALRIQRLGGSAEGLARGVAIGVFVATLPLPGLQIALAASLAWVARGNVPAAVLGTFWANPVTLPVLWLSAHWVGSQVLGSAAALTAADLTARLVHLKAALMTPGSQTLAAAWDALWPVFMPTLIGAVPIAIVSAVVFYWFALNLIEEYRRRGRPREADMALPLARLGEGR